MSPWSVKMRFDSQLSRMNCQMFSTGLRPAPDVIRGQGIWGQRQECDVFGHDQVLRQVPACLIEQQQGMTCGGNHAGDLGQMQVHRLRVAYW